MSQPIAFYEKVLLKYGFTTFAAAFLIWWLTSSISGTVQDIQKTLHDHIIESAIYQYQTCLNTAQLAGNSTSSCGMPPASIR